jgi:class 3 adenylate cyclase
MAIFFQGFLDAGIHPQLTSQEARHVSFLNTIVLLVLLLILLNFPLPLIEVAQLFSGRLLIVILIVHFIMIALTLLFNFLRWYRTARIYFGYTAATFMTMYALVMGPDSRWSFFLPIVIFVQFYIYPPHEKRRLFFVIAYCVLCFIGCELWFVHYPQGLANFPAGFISGYKYVNSAGFLFCAVALGMTGYTTINRAEKKLAAEHLRSERLLLNVLPASIAKRLKEKEDIIADSYANVTILFADIAGFTPLAANLPPDRLIQMLNGIFSKFDELADRFGLEKIKTIGDAYMVVGGVPDERKDHAEIAAAMGLAMLEAINKLNIGQDHHVDVRIGICSGPVIAGVIGKKKFSYDLWGDSVNTAARMEANGIPGQIHVTESTFQLLESKYSFDCRGMIQVRGKGLMKTYFLKNIK